MEQQELNMRIAMSLLRQCAWVWEYCTRNDNEGEFKFSEVMQGFGRNFYKSKPGNVMQDMDLCPRKHWDIFNKMQPIEGLTFDRKEMRSTVKIENYSCSFFLKDVFFVTERFCKWNCPSMANKARFCYKGGERWAELPTPSNSPRGERKKKATTKTKAIVKPMPAVKPLTLAEQLRQALLARMAA